MGIIYSKCHNGVIMIPRFADGVSTSGTDLPIIQLGYGGTPTYMTSGYSGGSQQLSTVPSSSANQPGTGFVINSGNATNALIGVMTITILDASTNTWIASYNGYNNTTNFSWSAVTVALSGTMSAVRLTRVGTVTFDAGVINILYE